MEQLIPGNNFLVDEHHTVRHRPLSPYRKRVRLGRRSTHSQTSNTTCWRRSGNFCTIVTGCPDVRDTPYIGAVVLYRVRHSLEPPHVFVLPGVRPGMFVALAGKRLERLRKPYYGKNLSLFGFCYY